MNRMIFFFCIASLFLFSCSSEVIKTELIQEFTLEEGFKIEAVAAEPLLNSLVEIEFDEKGRIWTLEMTGYMRDIDGSGEEIADGKISILEDKDGDGFMESKNVFIDGLVSW